MHANEMHIMLMAYQDQLMACLLAIAHHLAVPGAFTCSCTAAGRRCQHFILLPVRLQHHLLDVGDVELLQILQLLQVDLMLLQVGLVVDEQPPASVEPLGADLTLKVFDTRVTALVADELSMAVISMTLSVSCSPVEQHQQLIASLTLHFCTNDRSQPGN